MSQADAVVVGAGITGLTCAYRLQKLGIDTLLLESSDRVGGVIRTERVNGHLVEWGPTSLLPTEHTFALLE
jgi:oxygen-dependent protoporphyrinogen oxidase